MKNNSRRDFLRYSALTAGAIGISSIGISVPKISLADIVSLAAPPTSYPFMLPPLTYGFNAMEPFIDTKTMEIHHDKHHQAYVEKLNAAMEKFMEYHAKSLETLFAQITTLPEEFAKAIRNHGGGHYNHSMLWKLLTPEKNTQPSDALTKAINISFTSLDNLKTEMSNAANGVFGSGWAWLIMDSSKKLSVITTPNQENPLMADAKVRGTPILGIDVWEHAYYLKHQNKKADYVTDIWNVINWKQVSDYFGA